MRLLVVALLVIVFIAVCFCDDDSDSSEENRPNRNRSPPANKHPRRQNDRCTRPCNERKPVCGENGVTYTSLCHLKKRNCRSGNKVLYSYRGRCKQTTNYRNNEDSSEEDSEEAKRPMSKPKPGKPRPQPPAKVTRPPKKTKKPPTTTLPTTIPTTVPTTAPTTKTTEKVLTTILKSTRKTPTKQTDSPKMSSTTLKAETTRSSSFRPSPAGMQTPGIDVTTGYHVTDEGYGSGWTTMPFMNECPTVCPLQRQLVCGTDGTTYQSPCVLQLVACVEKDPTLMVASLGECDGQTTVSEQSYAVY